MFLGTHTPRLDERAGSSSPRSSGTSCRRGLWSHEGRNAASTSGPSAEFRSFTEQLRKAPVTNKSARKFMRMLFAGASAETAGQAGPGHAAADAPGLRRTRTASAS